MLVGGTQIADEKDRNETACIEFLRPNFKLSSKRSTKLIELPSYSCNSV